MKDGLPEIRNLYYSQSLAASWAPEHVETLLTGKTFSLERIISRGHVTPPGQWYDQSLDEWVLLAAGRASIELEGKGLLHLRSGDYLLIPAGMRHRVTYTSSDPPCIWLALHGEL